MHRDAGHALTDLHPGLEFLRSHRETSAIVLDFDGSLAPIVDDPESARADPRALDALASVVDRYAVVAIVSGRPAAFLAAHVPVPGVVFAGLYGLETSVDGIETTDPRVELHRDTVASAAEQLDAAFPDLYVERKGIVSVALHWRRAPDREAEAIATATAIGEQLGLDVMLGRRAAELRPAIPVDKGTVVDTLIEGLDAAMFAGDDEADLAAFRAIDARVATGALQAGVAVAVRSLESPPALLAAAQVEVDGPAGLAALVHALSE